MSFSTSPDHLFTAAMMRLSLQDNAFDAASSLATPSSSPSPSIYSFDSSQKSNASSSKSRSQNTTGGLSRSRRISDLSALGGTASETSISRHHSSQYASCPGPNAGWGYFADTPRKKMYPPIRSTQPKARNNNDATSQHRSSKSTFHRHQIP